MSNITKSLKLKVYTDPGHAWLAVPIQKYRESGIKASSCSYVNNTRSIVYLEEDIDAGKFIEAMQARGITIRQVYTHTNKRSRIRNMESIIKIS